MCSFLLDSLISLSFQSFLRFIYRSCLPADPSFSQKHHLAGSAHDFIVVFAGGKCGMIKSA